MERVPAYVFVIGLVLFLNFGDLVASPIEQIDVPAVKFMSKSIGGGLGFKALGASGALIQILVKVLQSKAADRFFQKQKPWVRLSIISVLTFSITPVGLVTLSGLTVPGALLHTATLNAFMVFLDQVLKNIPGNTTNVTTSRK